MLIINTLKLKMKLHSKINFGEQIKSRNSYLLLEESKILSRDINCGFYILYNTHAPQQSTNLYLKKLIQF